MSYKIYYYSEIKVCNGDNIKILKELTEFDNKFGIIIDFLNIEYGYANEDLLHLNVEEMSKLLDIIENETLFNFMSKDYLINEYDKYLYNYIKYNKYVIYSPSEEKDLFYTKDELLNKFLKELKDEIICIRDNIKYDRIKDFYIGWE